MEMYKMPADDFTVEDMNQLQTLSTLLKRTPLPQLSSDKTTILVMGNTGAGKSSIIDMLIEENATCRPVIGLRAGRSQTVLPEIFVDKVNPNVLYVDCPGFEDTRLDTKPALALLMQSLVHNNAIKGVLIMIDTRSFGDKAMALLKLLTTLNQLLKQGVPIETACIFGITRVAPEPAAGTQPNREHIYSLESLGTVLEDLRLGFEEDLAEELEKHPENAQQQTRNDVNLSQCARELIAKMSMIVFLKNAILASRVVLVHDAADKKNQICENLRSQFQLLSNGNSINDALNFENYDIDRKRFMDKILKKSTELLTILEQERAATKQRNYLVNSNTLASSEQRLKELSEEITQKETELSRISSRETASEPYWTETKTVVTEHVFDDDDRNPEGNLGYYKGSVQFSYSGSAPIAKIELIGGNHFNYLRTFWNTDDSLFSNIATTVIDTPMRLCAALVTLGLTELLHVGLSVLSDSYKFTYMRLADKHTALNSLNWEESITLPAQIESKHSIFSVRFEGGGGATDCYDRKPIVKVYVPICYMTCHPERIVSLKNLLVVLRQQAQTIQIIAFRSKEALDNAETLRDIQEKLLTDKTLLLTQAEDELKLYAAQIEQQQALMILIVDVFCMLRIPLHENLNRFMQLWAERASRPSPVETLQAIGTEAASATVMSTPLTIHSNSIFSLFHQNHSVSVAQSGEGLMIQAPRPAEGHSIRATAGNH